MLRFFKRGSGPEGSDRPSGSGFIQGMAGGVVVVNLDRFWWAVDLGMDAVHLSIKNAGGRETHGLEDHEEGLRGAFLRLGKESAESRLLQAALDSKTPVVILYPGLSRVRNMASDLFEDFIARRFKADSRDFDCLKLYVAPVRPGKTRTVRKFRGICDQVVFNLSGEGLNYFHLNTTERDLTVDAIIDQWPIGAEAAPEALTKLIEVAIRRMDREYFDRLRDGIEKGTLFLLLPERADQRNAVLGAAGRLLERAPGGGIDLLDHRVVRFHRTNRSAESAF
ncbi:MAG: hypothetical protein CMJ67_08365 [Planctomycetaceae bacterium]|nr:hypothetical protein [Planctomycetaceae bacterium]